MSGASADMIAKWIGLAVGLAGAAILLAAWRVPAAGDTLGADVKLVAAPPGELTLHPPGAFLEGSGLTAGGPGATGALALRNITGRALAVRVRLLPSTADLDGDLRVALTARGRRIAGGSLGRLRRFSSAAIRIAPGASRRLQARVFVAPGARNYAGRIVDVTVELRARPVRKQ